MKFIGIDFGWQSGPSGLCVLDWQNGVLQVQRCDRLSPLTQLPLTEEAKAQRPKGKLSGGKLSGGELSGGELPRSIQPILDWLDRWLDSEVPGLIAVDAPTLIPNATGMRLPDRLTHQYFRRYHAGAYPANLGRPFAQQTLALGTALESRQFAHAPTLVPRTLGRYQIEVFPHPATVHLFGLSTILKYKKGKLADRRHALDTLRHYLLTRLPTLEPALDLTSATLKLPLRKKRLSEKFQPEKLQVTEERIEEEVAIALNFAPLIGSQLKAIEDQLDAILCAYIGAYWWYWGVERNWVLGDRASGYIIVPAPIDQPN